MAYLPTHLPQTGCMQPGAHADSEGTDEARVDPDDDERLWSVDDVPSEQQCGQDGAQANLGCQLVTGAKCLKDLVAGARFEPATFGL